MFVATIRGLPVVPYTRMTQKVLQKKARRYLKNQHDLAWMIKAYGHGKVRFPCILFATIKQKTLRKNADLDNIVKAITDALVKAGVIPDDSLKYITGYSVRAEKADSDSIEILLTEARDENKSKDSSQNQRNKKAA